MSKARHKVKPQNADVTLNDFANSKVPSGCGRLKKRSWLPADANEQDTLPDDVVVKGVRRRKKPPDKEPTSNEVPGGVDYPYDVWCHLSKYIRPEDVGRFAGICKSSYAVVKSAGFWFSLYKRYYQETDKLPERFRKENLTTRYKLRKRVIQFLYLVHEPYTRITLMKAQQHMYKLICPDLIGMTCIAFWQKYTEERVNKCSYHFKLREEVVPFGRALPSRTKPDLLTMLDDIYANDDEGCKLLVVDANSNVPVDMIVNLRLRAFSYQFDHSWSLGCREMVLRFSAGPSQYQMTTVHIKDVIFARLLNWWERDYVSCPAPSGNDFSPLLDFEYSST